MADRIGKACMCYDSVSEEGVAPDPFGAVNELIRNHDMAGGDGIFQRTDRRNRDDLLDTQLLHAVDIGAVVDLGRQQAVPASVTRQKHHLDAVQNSGHIFVGRIAEGGLDGHPLNLLQTFHIIQTAAADNPDSCFTHCFNSFRRCYLQTISK